MNKDQWQQIEKIFYAAMELPRDEREAFISQACAGDEELLREVQALLAANQDAESFLDSPVNMPPHSGTFSPTLVMPHPTASAGAEAESGVRIGAYRLIREIGRGGMGAVWLAERADGQFYQQVAIKLLHAGSENEEVIRRFRHERQILASLDHPNIARLLDGGTTEDGRPYFVMEYIEGLPIDEYCRQHQLSVDDRLKLFRQVCAAVHYAHQNLVIHRDLKPSNIAVTADGTPKLLDFGIAKLIQPDLSRSYDTLSGVTPMTPAYASPEQVRGEKLTTASDVYSLGVVLYELLTGRSPYRLKAHGFGELMRAVIEQEPERPSTAITREDGTPPTNPITIEPTEKLRRRLSGDIDSIVLMALRKEPPSRYGSVEQFSEDLRRYLEGLPTVARRGTLGYRALKYIRRNKMPVAAGALILLSLLVGIGATLRQARIAKAAQLQAEAEKSEAQSQRNRAEAALTTAEERRQQAESARAEADQQRDEAEEQQNIAEEQRNRAESQELSNRRMLYATQMNLANTAWNESNIGRMHEILTAHIPKSSEPDLRGFEWYYLWKISHSEGATLQHQNPVRSVAFSPNGKKLVTIDREITENQTMRIWDVATLKEISSVSGKFTEIGEEVEFSKDGKFFATGSFSCGVILWEADTGKRIKTIPGPTCALRGLAVSPDGKKLAVGDADGHVFIYEAATGQQLLGINAHNRMITDLTFSPDGQKFASTSFDTYVKVWDTKTGGELLSSKRTSNTLTSAFSSEGRNLAVCLQRGEVAIWDLVANKETTPIKATTLATNLAYSSDGKMLAVGFNDRQVKVWDTRNWEELATIKGHGNTINSIAFSPDGRMLATASSDSTVKYWDLMRSQGPKVFNLNDSVVSEVAFSNTGKTLFVSSYNSTTFTNMDTRAYDIASGHETFSIQGPAINTKRNLSPQYRHLFALSGDGRRIALAGDKSIKIIDAITGKQIVETQSPGGRVQLVALSQDGRVISAICEGDREYITIVWNSDTGKESLRFNSPQRSSDGLVFLDNQTLLTLGPELQWWNLYRGKLTRQSETRLKHIGGVRLSPDGMRMAVTDRDGKIFLLDASTGQQQLEIKGFNASVRELAFSNDGKRLLAGGEADRIVKLFDLTTGQETISFPISRSTGGCAFSPDGRNVAITYLNSVKIYTAVDPKSVQVAGR